MRSVWIILLALPAVIGLDPCTQYNLLDEKIRSKDYLVKDKAYEHLLCDRILVQNWYRFARGDTIPTSCVDLYHCGTLVPLWINGTDPAISDGIVTRQICGKRSTTCCDYKDTIRMKNCGTYYVYELKPTRGCSIAYCAGTGVPCAPDKWSPTGYEPGCKDMYPKMINSPHLSNPIVKPDTFEFKCSIAFDPARRDVAFDVIWAFDNKTDSNIPVTHVTWPNREAVLDQKYLTGHLGRMLSCRVRSYFTTSPFMKGPFLPSNGYWCGIKLDKPSLTVSTKDPPQEVKIISTIPIVCQKQLQPSCKLEIYLDNNDHNIYTAASCTKVLTPGSWDPKTNQAVVPFQVSAMRDPKKFPDKTLALHFSPITSFDGPPVFNNTQIPYLTIHSKDKDTSTCYCTGDPHCMTFDTKFTKTGTYYDYYKVGEFMMYESTATDRLFQVQVRTWACWKVTCQCAVAAREGNDVVIIDMCHGHFGKSFPQVIIPNKGALSQGMVVSQNKAGTVFMIDFPSGAKVRVNVSPGKYFNVYVTPPEDDFGATRGLCGSFDGNRDNDLMPKGSSTPQNFSLKRFQPNSFVESWRIPIGSSLFDLKDNIHIDPKYNNDIYYCSCDSKKQQVDCSFDKIKGPPGNLPVTIATGGKGNANTGRRRRAVTNMLSDDNEILYFYDYGLSWKPTLRNFPTEHGKTKADAEKACNDAFNKHSTLKQCEAQAGLDFTREIDTCVEDFKYVDDGSLIESSIDAAVTSCIEDIKRNLSFYDARGHLPPFITTDMCPMDCSNKGTCIKGTCHCDRGYVGDGCEINARVPPQIYNIISEYEGSVLCDVTVRRCETIYTSGNNLFNNSKLSCRLEELKFDGTGFVATGRNFTTGVVYNTMNNIGCVLPKKKAVGGQTVIGYMISVTNDGHHYSNKVKVVKTDPTCLNCRDSGDSCQISSNTCMIDGNCRKSGEVNAANHNLKCDPSMNSHAWTSNGSMTVTLPSAPLGGVEYKRFDVWTSNKTGCQCSNQPGVYTCACCDEGGCQCPSPNQQQCTICGSTKDCGTQ